MQRDAPLLAGAYFWHWEGDCCGICRMAGREAGRTIWGLLVTSAGPAPLWPLHPSPCLRWAEGLELRADGLWGPRGGTDGT